MQTINLLSWRQFCDRDTPNSATCNSLYICIQKLHMFLPVKSAFKPNFNCILILPGGNLYTALSSLCVHFMRARTNAIQMCTQRPILCEQLQLHFQACAHNYASHVCTKYAFNPRTQSRFNFLNVHFNSSQMHVDSRTEQAEVPKTGSQEEASMPNALQLSEVKILHVQISWCSIVVFVSSLIIASSFFVLFDVSWIPF